MVNEYINSEVTKRMESSIASLKHALNGLRTGRASTSLLDPIKVEAYGSPMPVSQVGSVNTPEPRLITVQVWDTTLVNAVVKSILESGLGLNPIAEGQVIRIPLPDLSEERRKELAKKAHEYGEGAKVSIRNIRRDGNDHFKKLEKDKAISEDDYKRHTEEIQKATDDFVKKVDMVVEEKIKEIMQV
jgi:ribosome recycling factor